MQTSSDTVWQRIRDHAGEDFLAIDGTAFQYKLMEGSINSPKKSTLQVVGNRHPIYRSTFEKAMELVPLQNTSDVKHLRGPSYLYGILMDERIRCGDW